MEQGVSAEDLSNGLREFAPEDAAELSAALDTESYGSDDQEK